MLHLGDKYNQVSFKAESQISFMVSPFALRKLILGITQPSGEIVAVAVQSGPKSVAAVTERSGQRRGGEMRDEMRDREKCDGGGEGDAHKPPLEDLFGKANELLECRISSEDIGVDNIHVCEEFPNPNSDSSSVTLNWFGIREGVTLSSRENNAVGGTTFEGGYCNSRGKSERTTFGSAGLGKTFSILIWA
ncbi:Rab3 GTPase-activating protein catalytic subunit [Striga asiatica]|uniref:Rab3 GTPase-activating protein catalytic subunit n=1 Tax=Striga asiatica TaxID=4170 RepID=A0A5A7Q5P4_STRAF|nr:Rab3 GTPase-activating protein catalytic subunit [Striga asiatica]